MLNLIDQSDILKGLDDQSLQREMSAPSGGVPPFLVLSEISRRKDMRQRYAGEVANKAPQTTVMQDVLSAPSMPGMGGGMPAPAGGGGIAAAAQMMPPADSGGMPAQGPGYAGGGIVDAVDPSLDYSSLARKYQSELDSLPADRSQAQALALLAAGAGIMGGGHSNLGQNLGVGINAGLTQYQDALKTTDARETGALRGLSDLAANQHNDAIQRLQLTQDPNSVRELQAFEKMTPEQKQDFMNLNQPYAAQAAADKAGQIDGVVDMIHNGEASPVPMDYGRGSSAAIVAEYGKKYPGENLAQKQLQWKAAQTAVAHMNSNQVMQQQRNIATVSDQLGNLQSLADEWNAGQFPVLNAANFKLALQGMGGRLGLDKEASQKAQSIASQFAQQLAETKIGMQQVFANGYAPTDKQLAEIDRMFSENASNQTFKDLINLARTNINYRRQALESATGLPVGSTYSVSPATSAATVPLADNAGGTDDAETNALVDKWLK